MRPNRFRKNSSVALAEDVSDARIDFLILGAWKSCATMAANSRSIGVNIEMLSPDRKNAEN